MTFVAKLEEGEMADLEKYVKSADFELREIQHARFSAKGEGVVCTLYKSGKVVVQGAGTETFVRERFPHHETPEEEVEKRILAFAEPVIGSDESGKGDYFGPLVTAAVALGPDELPLLQELRVVDSKKLGAKRLAETAARLRECVDHEEVVISPRKYNELYAKMRNLNLLLAWSHATAIEKMLETRDVRRIVIDKFCDEQTMRRALKTRAREKELELRPRAEENPAVAAASIIAADGFRRRLAQLGRHVDLTLPQGAGPPVIAAAKRLISVRGREILGEVAKLHFSITERL